MRWRLLFLAGGLAALAGVGCSDDSGQPQPDASVDVEGADADSGPSADQAPAAGKVGAPCSDDQECDSTICHEGRCAKGCSGTADCAEGQECGSDDGKRLFCFQPAYRQEIGSSCAVTGTCSDTSMKCLGVGGGDNAGAFCSTECADDTDCPPRYYCRELSDEKKYCARRGFCSRCLHDGNCAPGGSCVKQGTESFCSQPCHQGSTECPRYAECKEVRGRFQCVHKAGTCAGTGAVCQPCVGDTDCEKDALCLSFTFTQESFCATSCASASCPGAQYSCEEIPLSDTEAVKQCVPADPEEPSCVALSPTMEKGDLMHDFAMVGYADENANGSLADESLRVIKLSEFATSSKVILFNLAAGWCVPCMLETSDFAGLMQTYGPKGLMIVQVLFDADQQGVRPTLPLLNAWVKAKVPGSTTLINPQGACGIDPGRNSVQYNTGGTTPLNMLLDAKTRRVLEKFNGYEKADMVTKLQALLGS